jgi:HTH-type transcriptional regulator / antitoxin HigA
MNLRIKKDILKKFHFKSTNIGDLRGLFPIQIISSKNAYYRSKSYLEYLAQEVLPLTKGSEKKELIDYIGVLGSLINDYEKKQFPHSVSSPKEMLTFLMKENGLKQKDLIKEFGSQSLVSDALTGKIEINLQQAKKLGKRFKLDPKIFLEI